MSDLLRRLGATTHQGWETANDEGRKDHFKSDYWDCPRKRFDETDFTFFSVPVRSDSDGEAALKAFLRSHRVVAIDRRRVGQGADSYEPSYAHRLAPSNARRAARGQKVRAKGCIEILSPEEFAVFAQLRRLRQKIAQVEVVPVYTIFTNEQ
jgi:hypothetical protein